GASTHSVSLAFSDNAFTPNQLHWQYSFTTIAPPPVVPTTKDVFTDNFESYISGAGDSSALDKNLAGGPNAAPNGSGHPWVGIATLPNIYVVGTEGGVTPHSGTNMIRGLSGGGDFDQVYYNL